MENPITTIQPDTRYFITDDVLDLGEDAAQQIVEIECTGQLKANVTEGIGHFAFAADIFVKARLFNCKGNEGNQGLEDRTMFRLECAGRCTVQRKPPNQLIPDDNRR